MTCIWRIHGSKPYIFRWSLIYNTSVFCFSHFHLERMGGWSEPNETNFIWKKLSHFETIPKRDRKIRLNWNDIVDKLKKNPKPCKCFSKQYILNVKMLLLSIQSKWKKEVHTEIVIEDWSFIYCIPFFLLQKTLNYKTFNINLYIES